MFIKWSDPSVRLTGRWSRLDKPDTSRDIFVHTDPRFTTTTAPGSYFELAFTGEMAVLRFDLGYLGQPFPHLWVQVDEGAMTEVPVDRYLRVMANGSGNHTVRVTYKGGMEQLSRWYPPLMGAISFIGAEAEGAGVLPPDDRRIIEFIGDSITEGVLTDADYDDVPANPIDQFNRPYQDDNCATYGSLTARALGLRPIFQAYGATGMTRAGCSSVPRCGITYPWVFDHVPYTGETPDYIVINHGANDRGAPAEEYLQRYGEFLDLVRSMRPEAVIVCLGAFCGAFDRELGEFIAERKKTDAKLHFVSSKGWVPLEPLHPLRGGHQTIADHLVPILKEIFGI